MTLVTATPRFLPGLSGRPGRGARAFTFVEILVAMMFMAILLPVAVEGLKVASRTSALAERKRIAARLAEMKLNELIATGQWSQGSPSGDFGSDAPDFRWSARSEAWAADNTMTLVTVEVAFKVQENDYFVTQSTLAKL